MKQVKFIGTSLNDIKKFPEKVRQRVGYQILKAQKGEEPNDWKPVNSLGPGVKEIRIHFKNEYRVIYTAKFKDVVYVLHAFHKKTQKTQKRDLDLAKQRYNTVSNR
jgi:putative addiction module killer protein